MVHCVDDNTEIQRGNRSGLHTTHRTQVSCQSHISIRLIHTDFCPQNMQHIAFLLVLFLLSVHCRVYLVAPCGWPQQDTEQEDG